MFWRNSSVCFFLSSFLFFFSACCLDLLGAVQNHSHIKSSIVPFDAGYLIFPTAVTIIISCNLKMHIIQCVFILTMNSEAHLLSSVHIFMHTSSYLVYYCLVMFCFLRHIINFHSKVSKFLTSNRANDFQILTLQLSLPFPTVHSSQSVSKCRLQQYFHSFGHIICIRDEITQKQSLKMTFAGVTVFAVNSHIEIERLRNFED